MSCDSSSGDVVIKTGSSTPAFEVQGWYRIDLCAPPDESCRQSLPPISENNSERYPPSRIRSQSFISLSVDVLSPAKRLFLGCVIQQPRKYHFCVTLCLICGRSCSCKTEMSRAVGDRRGHKKATARWLPFSCTAKNGFWD